MKVFKGLIGSLANSLRRIRLKSRIWLGPVKYVLWNLFHLPHLWAMLYYMHQALSPRDSFLSFYFKLRAFKKLVHSKRYQESFKNLKYVVHGQESIAQAIKNRPVVYLLWHHGAQDVYPYLAKLDKATGFSAASFGLENIVQINDDNSYTALASIYKILQDNGRISLSFDGGVGKKEMQAKIFGSDMFFAKNLNKHIRNLKPAIVPLTFYVDKETLQVDFYFHAPLFSDDELENFTDQEMLEKTISFFENDLSKRGPYQIAYWWLWKRMQDKERELMHFRPWWYQD